MKNIISTICQFLVVILFFSCSKKEEIKPIFSIEPNCGTEAALSTCLTPKFSPEYYIDQGVKYFLTMQSDIPISVIPKYSDLVVRWEWKPWLLLTGYEKKGLIQSNIVLKLNPTAYDLLDCKYFDTQPFCRCHVIFDYGGEPCPIYEEFTFNDQGEITFIEAWSDFESLLPMTSGADGIWDEKEYWGETDVYRLSTKVPGLGNETGRININSEAMKKAIKVDKDVADMVRRIKDPYGTYYQQIKNNFQELQGGCEAPEGDIYPYYVP
ncbi:MAG: hypothetical protein IPN93_14530 [Bacteroidetes bacterium]|jgi:hypothetical protein|nr:hypothetical protein [Bacteroidota bacterium]MBP7256833.1 hypothetical protein [Chitinophagales bacterium]MBK7640550.1 hypothetical protein [Bacteroidota bacterium]MBK8674136.1 hypothetical protein [Bacteroidota bacterium]MBK9354790.1 hypothetical protein [Bacteroidota bacterium]